MGAQVASYVSQDLTTKKIQRITALDPAVPGYQVALAFERLSSDDPYLLLFIQTLVFPDIVSRVA